MVIGAINFPREYLVQFVNWLLGGWKPFAKVSLIYFDKINSRITYIKNGVFDKFRLG